MAAAIFHRTTKPTCSISCQWEDVESEAVYSVRVTRRKHSRGKYCIVDWWFWEEPVLAIVPLGCGGIHLYERIVEPRFQGSRHRGNMTGMALLVWT